MRRIQIEKSKRKFQMKRKGKNVKSSTSSFATRVMYFVVASCTRKNCITAESTYLVGLKFYFITGARKAMLSVQPPLLVVEVRVGNENLLIRFCFDVL